MGKRNSQLTELLVVAQNDYLTIVDTSAGQSKRVSVKTLVGNVDLGWVATGESWTFSSWTSATRIGVITVPSDATTKYTPGMRTRFSQTTGGTKYGIIVAVTTTTLTVFFPSGTTFVNETVTSPVYSSIKAPYGFPGSPTLWTVSLSSTSDRSPAVSTSYASHSDSLTVGVGAWFVRYSLASYITHSSTATRYNIHSLSTSSPTETDADFNTLVGSGWNAAGSGTFRGSVYAEKYQLLATQTTYTLIQKVNSATSVTAINISATVQPIRIEAKCAYL